MSITFAVDQLLERDDSVEYLELLLAKYPESSILTLSHQRGTVLGQVEMHRIQASFLAKNGQSLKSFLKKSFLIPKALKQLANDVQSEGPIFSISSGFIQGLLPERQLCFFWGDLPFLGRSGMLNRFFKAYLEDYSYRMLSQVKFLLVTSEWKKEQIQQFLPNKSIEVLPPAFNVQDFPLGEDKRSNQWALLMAKNLNSKELKSITNAWPHNFPPLKVLGVKGQPIRNIQYIERICSPDLAKLLNQAYVYLDPKPWPYFTKVLASLACETPVYLGFHPEAFEWLGGDIGMWVKDFSEFVHRLPSALDLFEQTREAGLRKKALKFNQFKFIFKVDRYLQANTQYLTEHP